MTELCRPISRKTEILLDRRLVARRRDRITVTLYPTKQIGFRACGCRKEVRLDLAVAYRLALIEESKQALLRKQQEAKAPGRKLRKSKRSSFFLQRLNLF
jgi:hypothetical protein